MKHVVLTLCASLLFVGASIAQPGTNNLDFNVLDVKNGDRADDHIEVATLQSDGKLIIGGRFKTYDDVPTGGLVRLDADGNLDATFKIGSGILGYVFDVKIQPDGKILVAGSFNNYKDTACANIIRLLPNGVIDKTFQITSGSNSLIQKMALQPDGKILIVGLFTSYGGVARNRIARLNSNGSPDLTFNPGTGANAWVYTVAIQPDGKILIGGDFATVDGNARSGIARLNANGTIDATFNPGQGANAAVEEIILQTDGKILIGGRFTRVGSTSVKHLARLQANGTVDALPDIGLAYSHPVSFMAVDDGGKILIGGYFPSGFGRLNSDGSVDNSLNPGSTTTDLWASSWGFINAIIVLPNGNLVIAGQHRYHNGIRCGYISWVKPNGELDDRFLKSTGANDTIFAVAAAPDGKLFIGGGFTRYNGEPRKGLARLQQDGTLDHSFNPITEDEWFIVKSILLQANGKVLVGGIFKTQDGAFRPLRRFNADGTLDATFDDVSGFAITAMALQPDGKIIAGGEFLHHPGNLIRVLPEGSLDPSWNMPFGFDGGVRTASLQPDGKIIVGGNFSFYQTDESTWVSRNNIARLNPDGTLDPAFDPGAGANYDVLTTVVQSDKKIIVGGYFDNFNGLNRNRLVRLHPDGSIDNTFLPEVAGYSMVIKMIVTSDEKIVIAGEFQSVNGATRHNIARLRPDGTLDLIFTPNPGANNVIYDVAETNDNNILIGGTFTKVDGIVRSRVAKLWNKSHQTISFDLIPDVSAGSGVFEIHASSSSGLPVSFTSPDPEISFSGNRVTPLLPGRVAIVAHQDGDETYSVADPVQRVFCINPLKPTITIDSTEPIDVKLVSSSDAHNQWFKDGTMLDGATAKVYAPVLSGVYAVQVTAEGCSSSPSDGYTLLITSTEQFRAHTEPSVYPNPASGKFISFSIEENVPSTITISDVHGAKLLAINNYQSKDPVSIEGLPRGIYLALVQANKQRYWIRFAIGGE